MEEKLQLVEDQLMKLETKVAENYSMEGEEQLLNLKSKYKLWLDREETM